MWASNSGVFLCSHESSGSSSECSCRSIATLVWNVALVARSPRSRMQQDPRSRGVIDRELDDVLPEHRDPSRASARCGFSSVSGSGREAIHSLAEAEDSVLPFAHAGGDRRLTRQANGLDRGSPRPISR